MKKKRIFYHTFRTWIFHRWIMKKKSGIVLLYGESGSGKTSLVENVDGITYITSQELSENVLMYRMMKQDKKESNYNNEIVVIDNIESIVVADNVSETVVKLFYEYISYLSKNNNTVICISTHRDVWFKKRVKIKAKPITKHLIRKMAKDTGLNITKQQIKRVYSEYKNRKNDIGSLKGELMMLNMINYMD